MACNCKKKKEIESKYGTPIAQSFFDKAYNLMTKTLYFIMLAATLLIVVPTVIVICAFKIVFDKERKFVFPKFLTKQLYK